MLYMPYLCDLEEVSRNLSGASGPHSSDTNPFFSECENKPYYILCYKYHVQVAGAPQIPLMIPVSWPEIITWD